MDVSSTEATEKLLLLSTGVSPRLLRISALFIQNSSMRSFRFNASSAVGLVSLSGSLTSLAMPSLRRGVDVMTGEGCKHTGDWSVA